MEEPIPKFTPQQLVGLKESATGIRKMIRLLNSGPGGVVQLKRELKERLEFVDHQIFVAERDQA
ncbi:hypothetical protein [Hyphomicrobium sp. DY-1]|uniref:hypothetical protein n=1 Tax=Hyphomicrobium sp. DY-1 TaxID=3075650 RepID=UPI0039C343CB